MPLMTLSPLTIGNQRIQPEAAWVHHGVTIVVGAPVTDELGVAVGDVVVTSDGRTIAHDPNGRGLSSVNALHDIVVSADGDVFVMRDRGRVLRSTVALEDCEIWPVPDGFTPLVFGTMAASSSGLWLAGQNSRNSGEGWVVHAADGKTLAVVAQNLSPFVHRITPWQDGVLACAGKTLSHVRATGASVLKSFRHRVVDAWGEGDTICVMTESELCVSRNAGKAFKSALKLDRKLYGSERSFVTHCLGTWLASVPVTGGKGLAASGDGVAWEPAGGGVFGDIDFMRPTERGVLVIGRHEAGRIFITA